MDIKKVKVNSEAIDAGEWVKDLPEMDDLEVRVRGLNNADYENLQQKLILNVPFKRRRRGMQKEDRERIQNQCLIETVLYDWRNLTDGGTAVPYSKEAAEKYIADPDYRAFRDAVIYAASIVGESKDEEDDATEKNSDARSATS